MNLLLTFAVIFVGGPVIFLRLLRGGSDQRALAAVAGLCMAGALALRYGLADVWGIAAGVTIAGLLLIWVAWVAVLVLGARAFRRRAPGGRRTWRLTSVIGAMATTAPWFGLASADFIAG